MRFILNRLIKLNICFLFSLTAIFSQTIEKTDMEKKVQNIIHQVQMKYAPDSRTAIFNIIPEVDNNLVVIKGETNRKNARDELIKEFENRNYKVQDSVRILPSKELGESIYGIINLSVANMRLQPFHNEELVSQSLLGVAIRIYKKEGGWYLIQTPDEYIAWVLRDAIKVANKSEYEEWIKSDKIIYTSAFGFSFSEPKKISQTVSDLVKGDILKVLENKNGFFKVEYPDQRIAYIPVNECEYFEKYVNELKINAENVIKTAKTFMGIPYLWGGTSIKGVDCSGFTKSVYYLNGILLPRDVSQQIHVGEFITNKIDFEKLQPADLLFFSSKGESKIDKPTHVGIYLGDGKFIHSSGFVKISGLITEKNDTDTNGHRKFLEARRILTSLEKNGIILLKNSMAYFKVKK